MSINDSNTLHNIKYNYTNIYTGYDQRYLKKEPNLDIFKSKMHNLILKKKILDVLKNKHVDINIKHELIKKYEILEDNNNIKPINLKAGKLIDNFEDVFEDDF
jgi:hypothetical protein